MQNPFDLVEPAIGGHRRKWKSAKPSKKAKKKRKKNPLTTKQQRERALRQRAKGAGKKREGLAYYGNAFGEARRGKFKSAVKQARKGRKARAKGTLKQMKGEKKLRKLNK